MKKVIIIGCGAMGGAILSGCLAHDIWKKEEVSVREHSEEASAAKAKQYGTEICHDLKEAETADLVLIAVKPNIVPSVLKNSVRIIRRKSFPSQRPLLWKPLKKDFRMRKSSASCQTHRLPSAKA